MKAGYKMAKHYEEDASLKQMAQIDPRGANKRIKKQKEQKVLTLGVISSALLLGIISFTICFIVGMGIGPNLPI